MSSARLTWFLGFKESNLQAKYFQYESEQFLKYKSVCLKWLVFYCISTCLQNILEFTLSIENEASRPFYIANIVLTATALFALGISLRLLDVAHVKAVFAFKVTLFALAVTSSALSICQYSMYSNNSERFMMLLMTLSLQQTYIFITHEGSLRTLFKLLQAVFILVFNYDQFGFVAGWFRLRVLFGFGSSMAFVVLMCYLMARSKRLLFLEHDDWNQKEKIWKQIFDCLPQGAAIIDPEYNIKFDNVAFKELFGESSESEKIGILDQVMNQVSLRRDRFREKTPRQLSGYLDTPLEHAASKGSEYLDRVDSPDSIQTNKRDKTLRSFRSLINYVTGESTARENSSLNAFKSTHFFTFDSKMRNKTLEIKVAKSCLEGKDVIIALFTDTTDRELIAKLNEVNEFKDNLLSTVSHELKTPLNSSMLMISNSLMSAELPSEVKSYLTDSLTNHKRLELILSDILDYCLLNTKKFALNLDYFDIYDLLKELQAIYNVQAHAKNIQLRAKVSKLPSSIIRSDKKRLFQVLSNLLSNSIKFTQEGSIHIIVKEDPNKPRFIKIKVRDTGTGMSEVAQHKLRDHLKKGNFERKVTSSSSGAGLGLFVSHQLAARLGKGLTFYSEKDGGSTFIFSVKNFDPANKPTPSGNLTLERSNQLILTVEKSNQLNLSQQVKPSYETIMTSAGDRDIFQDTPACPIIFDFKSKLERFSVLLSNRRNTEHCLPPSSDRGLLTEIPISTHRCKHPEVIIADDDPFNVLSLATMIKKLGYDTFNAYNGKEVVNYLESLYLKGNTCRDCKGAKIVILDCNMPVMDGYTCVKILKKLMMDDQIPLIPVIACTAYIHQDERALCDTFGFDDCVPKPVDVAKLKSLLDKYTKPKIYLHTP